MGAIDFVDQEVLALELLTRPELVERLRGEIDLVLVDEFQDTSPLQLAIFLALAELAPRSVWVGDQKQSIFGFRGTDPALMDAAIDAILGGDEPETLTTSYRSRRQLVALTSDVFVEPFGSRSIPRIARANRRQRSRNACRPRSVCRALAAASRRTATRTSPRSPREFAISSRAANSGFVIESATASHASRGRATWPCCAGRTSRALRWPRSWRVSACGHRSNAPGCSRRRRRGSCWRGFGCGRIRRTCCRGPSSRDGSVIRTTRARGSRPRSSPRSKTPDGTASRRSTRSGGS